jgi:hypothetical protein
MAPESDKSETHKNETPAEREARAERVTATDVDGVESTTPPLLKTESGSTVRVPEVLDAPATDMHPGP